LVALIDKPLARISAFIDQNSPPVLPEEDYVKGYQILKITSTSEQMTQIKALAQKLGMGVEVLEDGMPAAMTELTEPNFDSFVAFDIETTGTYGANNGDAPAEITEIGAVKVVNGQIVERFSEFANPGREIVPAIARLTHITNEMVQDKPPIDEVIRKFKDFVDDSILVGHNIKSCDIPHISKATKRAGITFDNDYFDTYRYVKTFKESMGWENVKLEYLSRQFGISQPDAHRAYCDAEANVGVYFRLNVQK
jgi:DNA polymerase III epsilon subunit family exonuclease